MKRSRLFTMCLMLLGLQSAWAGPRSFRQAAAIAEKQAAKLGVTITQQAKARAFSDVSSAAARSSSAANSSAAASDGEAAAYYVFPYGDNQGFAIVSGDDQMPEIVAYSDKGTLDENNMSDGCREFLQAYKQMAEAVAQGDADALKLVAQKRALSASSSYKQPTVAPLLADISWDQNSPFNDQCPYDQESQKRCYTGCVATAMAQVMRYWKYPAQLVDDIPAYVSNEKYEISQINKGETYDWENMLPRYDAASNITDQQRAAVAKLMYHCGAAVQMLYSTEGSAAILVPQVMVKYFGYDPDLICSVFRTDVGLSKWCRLIDNELQAKRPVIYGGSIINSVGHQFVCDGTDGNGLYHINWGWSGIDDGYFDILILNPADPSIGGGNGGFNYAACMMIGLQPDNHVKDEPLVNISDIIEINDSKLEITKGERTSAKDAFKLTYISQLSNVCPEDFKGISNIGIKNEDGSYQPIAKNLSLDIEGMPITGVEYVSDTLRYDIEYAFPVGTTTLYQIYSSDNGATWQPALVWEGGYPLEVTATETSLSEAKEESDDFKGTISAAGKVVAAEDSPFTFTMSNPNKHDYYGEVAIYQSSKPEMPEKPILTDYVVIEAGGTTTHQIIIKPEVAGDNYLWLYDVKHQKVVVEAQKFTAEVSTSISAVPAIIGGLQISTAGKGMLSIRADKQQAVNIYNLSGQTVRSLQLQAGISTSISLPSGIYLVGNKKVMVK